MMQAGLVKEGMTVIEAIRDRYDGEKRDRWNELECGSNHGSSRSRVRSVSVEVSLSAYGWLDMWMLWPHRNRLACVARNQVRPRGKQCPAHALRAGLVQV